MYTTFFGLKCKPFQLSPDPEFLFLSGIHKRALTYLRYGIEEQFGFILITGEIGTGKTTIIRSMIKQLPQEIRHAWLYNTKVSSHQLISMINKDFGLDTKNKDKTELMSELTDFLIKQYSQGGRAVIIVDEAQNLSEDLLEEIRLLSNLETDNAKLLQIILIGQPELNEKLSRPGLEQLRQRISVSTHISPLEREDIEAYIKHRLKIAGNENCVTFEKNVMDQVYEFSGGTPRLINMLCEFAFLAAFIDRRKSIDIDFIKEIINDLKNERPFTIVAQGKNGDSSKDVSSMKIRKAFSSFHIRLVNLEAGMEQILTGNTAIENKKPRNIKEIDELHKKKEEGLLKKESELLEKEEELLKKESELLEKEELLGKREAHIRNLFEQTMSGSLLRKTPD
ncbi:MAG: XrtA/PEP-CTERM system-associated ATPase [Thermodesulfovibrionales bacterium]|jgi:putative secretion ATPase (PEP-CTERM system associated)